MVVAVHSTALGPALGGVRLWHYPEPVDGIRDSLRLAAGMTLKAAAGGLDLGGGKGVICAPAEDLVGERRRAALLDFGDLVESLGGRYITAEDVGISPDDLVTIRERTEHVTGLPPDCGGSGDPSPFTAIGVEAALRACARSRWGEEGLAGRTACVVGLGHVGERLARRLADAGCELVLSDIDPAKGGLADELGASWAGPDDAMTTECELLAPCAMGGAITDEKTLRVLRCDVSAAPANNQLTNDSLAPDSSPTARSSTRRFLRNAGGLIHVYKEIKGLLGAAGDVSSPTGSRRTLTRGARGGAAMRGRPRRGRPRASSPGSGSGRLCEGGGVKTDFLMESLLVCLSLASSGYEEARLEAGGALEARPGGGRGRRCGADARAPAGLYEGPAVRNCASCRWARTGTGCRESRWSGRPWRAGDLPRPRPARRVPDHGFARAETAQTPPPPQGQSGGGGGPWCPASSCGSWKAR